MDSKFSSEGHPEYSETYYEGTQGQGTAWMHKSVEKYWKNKTPQVILELGFGSGEHMPYHRVEGPAELFALDPAPSLEPSARRADLATTLLAAPAEAIPLEASSVDRIVSACVLAHVDDPERACLEMIRVLRPGGEIALALPTDPGMANQAIKRLVTYPKLKRSGVKDPQYFYAKQHRNPVNNLMAIMRHVFIGDTRGGEFDLRFHYLPLGIPSWNMNLLCVAHIRQFGDGSAR